MTAKMDRAASDRFDLWLSEHAPGMSREAADALLWVGDTPGAKEMVERLNPGGPLSEDDLVILVNRARKAMGA